MFCCHGDNEFVYAWENERNEWYGDAYGIQNSKYGIFDLVVCDDDLPLWEQIHPDTQTKSNLNVKMCFYGKKKKDMDSIPLYLFHGYTHYPIHSLVT